MLSRPRRNRVSAAIRDLVRETSLRAEHLIWPVFIEEGKGLRTPIKPLPGVVRYSLDTLLEDLAEATDLGLRAVALFPKIEDSLKNSQGTESINPEGLNPRAVRAIKEAFPDLAVITDVALDPYSSDGHDGIVKDGRILNDESVETLAEMAVVQGLAGADVVACSDMMDGRVGEIRKALDRAGLKDVLICSYCAKYASAFYDPFRAALDSAPRAGDKKTYQMDPGNLREALRELRLDEAEGADWILIKPGLPYLDVIARIRENTVLPVVSYHVSGEYSMLRAASENGWLQYDRALMETLLSLVRAGSDMIFTYGAVDALKLLKGMKL